MKVQALVLAGGADDPLAQYAQVPSKALCSIAGKTMGQYLLDTLDRCDDIVHITYVGPGNRSANPAISYAEAGDSFLESLRSGFAELAELTDFVLICSADIPFVTPEAVEHFLATSASTDLVYSIVTRHSCQTQFPAFKRTYVRLKEGVFSGGNAVLVRHAVLPQLFTTIQQGYLLRKQPWRLAMMLGPGILLKLILGQLTVNALEQRVSRITGITVKAFESPHASLATDIDKPEQLRIAETLLASAAKYDQADNR